MAQVLKPGVLLLAEPSLSDPNFEGTVILLCAHGNDGSLGLVLNRPTELQVDEILEDPGPLRELALQLSWGGPVGLDRLHVLHGGLGGQQGLPVCDGVRFGGKIEELAALHRDRRCVRFFLGYAGWDEGQLQRELDEATWRVLPAQPEHVFGADLATLWPRLLASVDLRYAWMLRADIDPRAN